MKANFYIILFLFINVFLACNNHHIPNEDNMTLEYKDVQGFSVNTNQLGNIVVLNISGLVFHSSLAVKEIKEETSGELLTLNIILVKVKKGLSGKFSFKINVPDSINLVVLGKEKYPVWKRDVK
jgi:hypothetical protein